MSIHLAHLASCCAVREVKVIANHLANSVLLGEGREKLSFHWSLGTTPHIDPAAILTCRPTSLLPPNSFEPQRLHFDPTQSSISFIRQNTLPNAYIFFRFA